MLRILVAEDSVPNQELIGIYFEMLGCSGDFVSNGRDAVERAKACRYDLCLMDMQMPGMGGVEAAAVIRREVSCDLPIVGLSADLLEQEEAMAAGMNAYLVKPLTLEKLKEFLCLFGKK